MKGIRAAIGKFASEPGRCPRPGARFPLASRLWGTAAFLLLMLFRGAADTSDTPSAAPNRTQFRFGFSSATFTEVNENDARAGMKVWAQMLFKEHGLPIEPEPTVLRDCEAIDRALRGKSIDAIVLNTDEYWKLGEDLRAGPFIGGLNDGRITEEYVLLVHRDSGFKRLEDLRGRSVALLRTSRMSLASVWLDTILVQGGLPRADEFLRMTPFPKLSKAVLLVFFRQADACLVTRRGFKTMGELNPQVSQRLQVLAASPELVPTGFCFRRDYQGPVKDTILAELAKIKDSPAGAQVLTLFQSGSLEAHPISCLDGAFELLETHRRLCGGTNSSPASISSVALDDTKGAGK